MKTKLAAWLRRLANWQYRLAAKLAPYPPVSASTSTLDDGDTQMAIANELIGKMQLRQALRRYSPPEQPGQC